MTVKLLAHAARLPPIAHAIVCHRARSGQQGVLAILAVLNAASGGVSARLWVAPGPC